MAPRKDYPKMATPKKKSAVVTARGKQTTALPAGLLGFSSLIEPDSYEGKDSFKLNVHYTPDGIEQLKATLQRQMDALLPAIEKAAAEEGAGMKANVAPQSVEDWLEGQLKEPGEGKRISTPFLRLKCETTRKGNPARGEPERVPVEVKAWPLHKNTLLDLKALKIGMGSAIVPIVYVNLFRSKQGKDCPQLSLKLVGFRVAKLVQFGGGFAPEETDDAAIREALGGDVDADDLSAFMAGGDAAPAAGGEEGDDPEALAAGMF